MDKRYTCKIICIFFILLGCSRQYYSNVLKINISSKDNMPSSIKINKPDNKKNFFSGTVSHHNLVSPIIDEWFYNLKQSNPGIKTFIVLSPKHYRFNDNKISITTSSWNYNNIKVFNNSIYSYRLIKALHLKEDHESFLYEHGIYIMIPFIIKYFPEAKIVPILMDEYNKNNSLSLKLSDAIFNVIKNDKNIFILISSDFSHKGNIVLTESRDKLSEEVLLSLKKDSINNVYSDNNVGLYVLMALLERMKIKNTYIMCNTNSQVFSSINSDDITSYFFTFQY